MSFETSPMASRIIFLFTVMFLSLVGKGMCGSGVGLGDLIVSQDAAGKGSSGQPQWKVSIYNSSPCNQKDVTLLCPGFEALPGKPEPSVVSVSGDECLIDNRNPILAANSFNFTYVSSNKVTFFPIFSTLAC